MALYPLRFEPIYKEKVWGGRALADLGRSLPAGASVGESWELADLGQSSTSGGGGGPERSTIANGPHAGRTLHALLVDHRDELMGRLAPNVHGEFPLLVKFLDANANLSLQVHPNPTYAEAHPEAFLKSEAWYIVAAEPGAVIYKGVRPDTTREQFRQAIADNTVEDLVIAVEVEPGQVHYLPSGTCHALGAGILVAEVQTPSDTTFRVYDWGREGRELHIEQALQCIDFAPADTARYEPHTVTEFATHTVEGLVRCEHFNIDRLNMSTGHQRALTDTQPTVWMVLDGAGRMTCDHDDAGAASAGFERGQTWLLPAYMVGAQVEVTEAATVLEVTFPQAMADMLA